MIADYSQEELSEALADLVALLCSKKSLRREERPRAFLLGGQSGAGKTTLHKVLNREFDRNVVVVNGDEYRALHPRFIELDERYGADSVSYTAPWAGAMIEALIDTLSMAGYNLIVEGTLRTASVPMGTAQLLRSRGYSVSLALMAVKPEISLVSCQIRYEEMRLSGQVPRATDPAHHDKIIKEIVGNLSTLEESGLFDEIRLYSRAKELLYPAGKDGSASDALRSILFGEWTEEEGIHYEFLQEKLTKLLE